MYPAAPRIPRSAAGLLELGPKRGPRCSLYVSVALMQEDA